MIEVWPRRDRPLKHARRRRVCDNGSQLAPHRQWLLASFRVGDGLIRAIAYNPGQGSPPSDEEGPARWLAVWVVKK
jgi:hypothetical protein